MISLGDIQIRTGESSPNESHNQYLYERSVIDI